MLESRLKRGGLCLSKSCLIFQIYTAASLTKKRTDLLSTKLVLLVGLRFDDMRSNDDVDVDVDSLVPQTPFQEQYLSAPQ